MNEAKKTIFGILSLYMISTMVFLGIIFGTWYFGELNVLKVQSFHGAEKLSKRLLRVVAKKGRYAYYIYTLEGKKAILQSISFDAGRHVMIFDENQKLIYNNTPFSPDAIPQKDGIFIIDDRVVLNSYGRPRFLSDPTDVSRSRPKVGEDAYRIVIDGGDIGRLLWKLRLKIWGLFGVLLVMMGVVGYFLVRLSLRPLNQKIQELDCFIKDTTHEINTPLSIMQMSIERINENKIPQEEIKKLHYIQTAAKTLANIYHSLVYISFGKIEPHLEKIDMQKLILERLDFFELLFKQKQIQIHTQLLPLWIWADQKSMVLVLDNLLSNAYKYTKKGGEVKIFLQENETHCLMRIEDNGCGIKEQDLKRIFHRYERFDASNGGFGLGLDIVKRICHHFGIELMCQSEYQQGSIFILSWKKIKVDDKG